MESDNNLNFEVTLPEKHGFETRKRVDGSWIRLIYVALKHQKLPADHILESVGIEVNTLRELNFIDRDILRKLYESIGICFTPQIIL